ncbi:hypothetical protein [Micromonospora aurantiaca (nom. illeg.)]|uniref:hypothetical protein n=2 Tax=Micromonospora aurantiaca (nom. illeg.) TaxID=47850 RepID=UPI00378962EB
MTTLMTINALDLYRRDTPADLARYAAVEDLIRQEDPDVIAVQEIIADGPDSTAKRPGAVRGLRRLADAVQRRCDVDGQPAVAVGGIMHHTGLLWRDGIHPVPDSLHTLTRDDAGMWHCAVSVVLDLGGARLRVGSVQLSPFDLTWATMDVAQVLRVFNTGDVPGLVGGDWNCLGGDPDYDPDPYQDAPWHPDHVYQLTDTGEVDRRPARRLEARHLGRMRDCARLAGVDWAATTGHHPADHHPPRRVDRWYATHHLPDNTVTGLRTISADRVATITDHLPVIVDIDHRTLTRT